jgi:hypothetical protein
MVCKLKDHFCYLNITIITKKNNSDILPIHPKFESLKPNHVCAVPSGKIARIPIPTSVVVKELQEKNWSSVSLLRSTSTHQSSIC